MKLKEYIGLEENVEKRANKYAKKQHKGQVRKFAGEPYVRHPERVAEIVKKYKKSKKIGKLVSAAHLHDTLEDTKATEMKLRLRFGRLVTSIVKELTSDKEEMKKQGGKRKYLSNKTIKMSSWALVIKLADRLDNVSDFKNASPDFVKSYRKQTDYMLDMLEKKRTLSKTHQKLIDDIRTKMKEVD